MRDLKQIIKNLEMCDYKEEIITALANIDDVIEGINKYDSIIMRGKTLELWKKCLVRSRQFLEHIVLNKEIPVVTNWKV